MKLSKYMPAAQYYLSEYFCFPISLPRARALCDAFIDSAPQRARHASFLDCTKSRARCAARIATAFAPVRFAARDKPAQNSALDAAVVRLPTAR
ncbi:hypothetical protein [uncultured Cloacibacillus sp.]|uniref:hypothetical protein n=1 Tax=uncultured Cloacibacillus sp. TaxID=889794 RepID=UPI0025DDB8B8|nr:hypothetical protein [uncultured Cloacibacillus sp.]